MSLKPLLPGNLYNQSSGGITQLTGDVTAGPGSGVQTAIVARIGGITVPLAIGAGSFLYNNAGTLAGGVGLTITAGAISALTIAAAQDTTGLTLTGTWNNAGVSPTAVLVNITKTATGANYKLVDWQFGGTTWLSIGRAASNDEPALLTSGSNAIQIGNANGALRIIDDGGGHCFIQSTASDITFSGIFGTANGIATFNANAISFPALTDDISVHAQTGSFLITIGGVSRRILTAAP